MPLKASLAQVRAASDGVLVEIDQDVLDVCARIRQIDPSLGIEYSKGRELFRVFEIGPDGRKRTVFWTPELTADIPDFVQRLGSTDYVSEMERMDRQAERDAAHAHLEKFGPLHERLAHAVRKDVGFKGRAFMPRGL